jgi:hypothetical protein
MDEVEVLRGFGWAGEIQVVGHKHQRGTAIALEREKQIHDGGARRLVEIAGGLVRHQDRRVRHDGAGNRHALLLAARQLRRIMMQSRPEAHGLQFGLRPLEGVILARQLQGERHVLECRHGGNEMEGLEHDADAPASKTGERILVEAGQIRAVHDHPAGIRALQSRHGHEQGGLSGARGTDETHRLALADAERNALQDMHPCGPAPEAQIDIVQRDGLVLHALSPDLLENCQRRPLVLPRWEAYR